MEVNKENSDLNFSQCKQYVLTQISRLIKRSEKWVDQKNQILQECRDWQHVYHQGLLLQANLFRLKKGISSAIVEDWEQANKLVTIPLDPLIEPKDQVAPFFRKSKKLRAGEIHAEKQLALAQAQVVQQKEQLALLHTINSLDELKEYCHTNGLFLCAQEKGQHARKAALKNILTPPKPYRIYSSAAGFTIWVGKSSKDNDRMTFQCARGADWWLHARDHAGSHVVIRSGKNHIPDPETLKDAAELAIRFSKAKDRKETEVVVCQVKSLSRVKSALGKVYLSKHKVMRAVLDESRWNRLRSNHG